MSPTGAAIALTRFGLGARPGEIEAVARAPRGWLSGQIGAAERLSGLPGSKEAMTRFQTEYLPRVRSLQDARGTGEEAEREQGRLQRGLREIMARHIEARTALAATTGQGFAERWVRFWSNHFTVAAVNPAMAMLAPTLEAEAVRSHAFSRFSDLLVAAELHPAMLVYLDQAVSVGPNSPAGRRRGRGLNENLAREILELHTLGADGGYDQGDVEALARMLTGWTIARPELGHREARRGEAVFEPRLHEPAAQTLMGRRFRDDGAGQARAALLWLAERPQTARHLAGKLARHFLADDPPAAAVDHIERAWLASGGDLSAVAGAVIAAPGAFEPEAGKFKAPEEYLISVMRALDIGDLGRERLAGSLRALGQMPFTAPSPAGWPDGEADWASPDALMKRLEFANALARRAADAVHPVARAEAVLGARLTGRTREAVARAESAGQGLTLLFMSPDFLRR